MRAEQDTSVLTNRTWLIQRLRKPDPSAVTMGDNPFAFGGGLRNGGLTENAMKLLRPIFAFDYMGAAEFEFGAVQKTFHELGKLATEGKLGYMEITTLPKPVYVIGNKDPEFLDEAGTRIKHYARSKYNRDLKETTCLYDALNPDTASFPPETFGWLELDNHFFFTVDKTMFIKLADLFHVKHPYTED